MSVTPPLSTTTTTPRLPPPATTATPVVTTPTVAPASSTGARPAPSALADTDTFARGSTPAAPRDAGPSAPIAADPALASELRSRRAAAGDARDVRASVTPIVGQSRGAGGATSTLRGSLSDALATSAAARPTGPEAPYSDFPSFPAEAAPHVAAVRSGLGSARDQMRSGDYAAAERTLHDLSTNHTNGFYGNARLGTRGLEATQTLERQAGFCARMETRLGHDVSCPPSEADTRAYFRSFNTTADRAGAQDAFRDYTRAFYTHTQQAFSSTSDVQYSRDTPRLVHGGHVYADGDRAAPDAAVRVTTRAPDSWADVTTSRDTAGLAAGRSGEHAGRRVIDCEGYAYLSSTLMGEAGYRVEHMTAGRPDGATAPADLHSMTRLTDPSSGARVIQSNGEFYDNAYTAYRSTGVVRAFESPAYFTADTMADSQAMAMDPVH